MKKRWIIVATLLLAPVASAGLLFESKGASAAASIPAVTPAPAVAGATVSISNFQFAPKVVRIKAGADVTWEVKEGTHTVTADNGAFESPALSAGKKFGHTFSTPGTYRYYCSFHGSKGGHDMAGTVVVTR
ncbi:MAG TPA: plastocyanin/azurin family copper-binding protein [Pyrinomonadaceae bacterium]|nr:plastocyanin/azurin family copper-binding protein [Pyrinomonadaceae bacterium]